MFAGLFGGGKKTFKPVKTHKAGSKQAALHEYARQTLGSGDVRTAVLLPPGEDLNEWLATNTVDMYNTTSILYGLVAETCTPESCPTMSAGSKYEFLWADQVQKKPLRVPAPTYVDNLMSWIEGQLADEALFPTSRDTPFPPTFLPAVKKIWSRLFRVFAHLYHHHFESTVALGAEKHLNTSLKHFVFFALTFDLLEKKEFAPLADLIDGLTGGALSEEGEAGGAAGAGVGASTSAQGSAACGGAVGSSTTASHA